MNFSHQQDDRGVDQTTLRLTVVMVMSFEFVFKNIMAVFFI